MEAIAVTDLALTTSVRIRASVAPRINAAFQVNSIPFIGEIEIVNETDRDYAELTIAVTSEPAFFRPATFKLDLKAHSGRSLTPVAVDLELSYLQRLSEAVAGEIFIIAYLGREVVAKATIPCRVLAPTEWTGLSTPPELIAAFIRPNDPSVEVILRNAAEKLRALGRDDAFDGYRSNRKARSWEIAEAIWAALVDVRIVYALPPASFEQDGQKIRTPNALLDRKIGTCLDLTLLYAACLEQAGLNPIVGFSNGHAFCGLWLCNETFSACIVDEAETIRKRLQLQDIILIEATLLTSHPPLPFRSAVDKAASYANEGLERRFELVVDVAQARQRRITPFHFDTEQTQATQMVSAERGGSVEIEEPPIFAEEAKVFVDTDQPLDRVEQWKRKLLDLSLRNRLLNFKTGKGSVDFFCPDAGALEDRLAKGGRLKILPAADVMTGADPRDPELHHRRAGEDAAKQHALDALHGGGVLTTLSEDDLQDRLIEIYQSARSSLEEGGANSLHLALGFLSWSPAGKDQRCRAPLLLMPVTLERRTIRSGFRLVRLDDDARINPTLLQMLRQDFRLTIPEFERDLLTNASGPDVPLIWRIARLAIKDMKGFELTEEVTLSNFSFAKYLMWKDLVDRTELLKRNRVVRHLIETPKETFAAESAMPEEHRLDEDVHPKELFMPLIADSSQTAAVVAASRGKDFVLFGPPGTGKSQTIANMIAQLLGDGRSVLFVSQKTTALEVVRRRLNDIGLGAFCLEVHSAKAQKAAVLNQLKTAWETRAADAVSAWETATEDLKGLRDRLNEVVAALHRRHGNGLSVHSALGRVVAHRNLAPELQLSFASLEQHDEAAMRHMRELCRKLKTSLNALDVAPALHPLKELQACQWSPLWQGSLKAACERFRNKAGDLLEAAAALADAYGVPESADPKLFFYWIAFASIALKPEAAKSAVLISQDANRLKSVFETWLKDRAAYETARGRLAKQYRDSVLSIDLARLLLDWRDALNAPFYSRTGKKKRVWDVLSPFAGGTMPADLGAEIAQLIEVKETRAKVLSHDAALSTLGSLWQGLQTEPSQVRKAFEWLQEATQVAAALANKDRDRPGWLACLKAVILNASPGRGRLAVDGKKAYDAYDAFEKARDELIALTCIKDDWLGIPRSGRWLREALALVEAWQSNLQKCQRWCDWQRQAVAAQASGLKPLIEALLNGEIAFTEIDSAFELAYARWWVERAVHADAVLRDFVSSQHEDAISQFVELDEKVAQLSRHVVLSRLASAVPGRNAFGQDMEFGVLSREIEKRARHMPLRRLFSHMPNALTRLTPCVMMSPLSVAQYLPADAKPFDVVIFDEASQIPVWDAIGAIARGNQVIVAGDPKQLPPTSFFDRGNDGGEDASDLEDLDSILDECLAANIPRKRLVWHYRSRHESLITFSNARYYDGQLVTFPSPVTKDTALRFVHVPGGIYERGSGRVNKEEARAVVREVVRRLSDPSFAAKESSIGVVTFNAEQQRLIERLLEEERRDKQDLERFFGGREWHEPVFVKNLESVQGDERDVILFSVAYGPDQAGKVSVQISTLNKDGGTRRLNVAITRARSELVVFATLRPEQIDLSRTKAAGIRDFKHFLEFAERGPRALAEAAAPMGDTESPFEDAVKKALEERGWVVHPQVGVSSFRVDLGIAHPDAPGRYLAGVECDGATYHRSATARDRDRLRERVLRNLGWSIHRVWSTDWWVEPDRAIKYLNDCLMQELESDRASESPAALSSVSAVEAEAPTENGVSAVEWSVAAPQDKLQEDEKLKGEPEIWSPLFEREEGATDEAFGYAERETVGERDRSSGNVENYLVADLVAAGFNPNQQAFYETSYRSFLRKMVAHVIMVEGPVFDDVLVQRIARAHGFARVAGRIRETVLDVVERKFPRSLEDGRKIFWPEKADKSLFPPFRNSSADVRDHTDIPLVELAALAREYLTAGFEPKEAAVMMARHLHIGRLREATRERFKSAAKKAASFSEPIEAE